jgi:hypothetical protein
VRISPLIWERPNVTPRMRQNFLKLSFPKQAQRIGAHARLQMEFAEDIVSKYISPPLGGGMKAMDIWEDMYGKERQDPGSDDMFDDIADLNEGPGLYDIPGMGEAIGQISEIFASIITFWPHHYYSCEPNGEITFLSHMRSQARSFNNNEMRLIDETSGMRYLGEQMKNYANNILGRKSLPNMLMDRIDR